MKKGIKKYLTLGAALIALASLNSCAGNGVPEAFLGGIGVKVKTDQGDITLNEDGSSGEIIIDQTSGK